MSGGPNVSVVIPTHNRPEKLRRAIDSVSGQSYDRIQIQLVETPVDGESVFDGDIDYDIPISHHIVGEDVGPNEARNIGISESNGTYIAFLDDDDEWLPAKTRRQVSQLETAGPSVGMSVASNVKFDAHGVQIAKSLFAPRDDWMSAILTEGIGAWSSWMVHRSVFKDVGYVDEELPTYEEYDFCLRVVMNYELAVIPEPLVIKHADASEQMGSSYNRKAEAAPIIKDRYLQIARENDMADEFESMLEYNMGYTARANAMYKTALHHFKRSMLLNPTLENLFELLVTAGGPITYFPAQRIHSYASRAHSHVIGDGIH